MKPYQVAFVLVLILAVVAAALNVGAQVQSISLNTRGLLCPACKVIIDYRAVSAAARGLEIVCTTKRCQSAAANLAKIADGVAAEARQQNH